LERTAAKVLLTPDLTQRWLDTSTLSFSIEEEE